MDKRQPPGVQIGNFDMGECFCEVTCRLGHDTRLFNIGRAHFVACDRCRTCIWVGSNLMSGWRQENEAVWEQNSRSVRGYRMVEPWRGGPSACSPRSACWASYQANICLFSPIHFDSSGDTIPAADWNAAANAVIDAYDLPPFGTLAGTNPDASSLRNWGHVDKAKWLGFHQIGNRRTHDSFALLSEIFRAAPAVPAINGEPYYDGMENAEGGSEVAGLYCRSAMYGSVLSGGAGTSTEPEDGKAASGAARSRRPRNGRCGRCFRGRLRARCGT